MRRRGNANKNVIDRTLIERPVALSALGLCFAFPGVSFFEALVFYALQFLPDAMLFERNVLCRVVSVLALSRAGLCYSDGLFEWREEFVAILGENEAGPAGEEGD